MCSTKGTLAQSACCCRHNGPADIATLHPTKDMNVKTPAVKAALREVEALTAKLKENIIYQKEVGGEAGDQVRPPCVSDSVAGRQESIGVLCSYRSAQRRMLTRDQRRMLT